MSHFHLRPFRRQLLELAYRSWLWWTRELSSCLPTCFKNCFESERLFRIIPCENEVIFQGPDGTCAAIVQEGAANQVDIGLTQKLRSSDGAVFFLPAGRVLRRVVQLPLAAAGDLAAAIPFVIEQQTPFISEKAAYSYRLLRGAKAQKVIHVEIAVTASSTLDYWQKWLSDRHVKVSSISLEGDNHYPRLQFPVPAKLRHHSLTGQLWKPLATAAGLAALIGPWLIVFAVHSKAQNLNALATHEAARAKIAEMLQRKLRVASATEDFLHGLLAHPKAVQILYAVTQSAPDDSWIFDLDLAGGKLTLRGTSSNVAALLESLQANPLLSGVEFIAPVTHDSVRHSDRFEMLVHIRQSEIEVLAAH